MPIILPFPPLQKLSRRLCQSIVQARRRAVRPHLCQLAQQQSQLPRFVRESPVAMRYARLLGPLAWHQFPERDLLRNWGKRTVPYAPFAAASLVKLDQGIAYMSRLREYLVDHPALVWLLGFPLKPGIRHPSSADADICLPTHRHFTRMLRGMPNASLQFLLDNTVDLLHAELRTEVNNFSHCVSMDTKYILAWVKENNPKAYVSKAERYDKDHQPSGDPDCRLGCKRRRNQHTRREERASSQEPPPTPTANPIPANTVSVGEFYWGYGTGVVATKIPNWGEFVLAELTQPFDRPDVSYFFHLMADVERRLGFRPYFAAFDAGFDAFYVYEYFHRDDAPGFAAVPFSKRGGYQRTFDPEGLPLCKAELAMPLKGTFWSKTTLVEHERGRYVCPLLFPDPTGDICPIEHKNWPKGCATTMPTSIGARIRYQLDRQSQAYKDVYKQRSATERVNSQAVALGIERPRLRNGRAIANQNTLIYILINLRALHRVRRKKAAQSKP